MEAKMSRRQGLFDIYNFDLPPIKRSTSRVSFLVQQPRRTHHEAETIQ